MTTWEKRGKPGAFNAGDVWALDYVPGFGTTVFDTRTIDDINRRLQHLTTWRQRERVEWDVDDLLLSIHESMAELIATERLDTEFRRVLKPVHLAVAKTLGSAGLLSPNAMTCTPLTDPLRHLLDRLAGTT
jgi:hypothetical protein